MFPSLKSKKFNEKKNAKAVEKITITKIVFQISEHKSIIFPKPVQTIDKMPPNLTVFTSINSLLPMLTEGSWNSMPAQFFSFQSYYHCYKWLCDGGIQEMNQNSFFLISRFL